MLTTYHRMMNVAGVYRSHLQKTLLLSVIASVIQGIIFVLFFPLLALLAKKPMDTQQVWMLLVLFGILVMLEGTIRWQELSFSWLIPLEIARDTRLRLAAKLRQMPIEELNQRLSGDLSVVMSGNVNEIVLWIGTLATLIIQTIVAPLIAVLVTLAIDWRLALALLITFPLAVPVSRYAKLRRQRNLKDISRADAQTAARIVEYVQGLPVLRATNQVGGQSQQLQLALQRQRQLQAQGQQVINLPQITLATLVEVGISIVLSLGTWLILQGSLTAPTLLALVIIIMRFAEPLAQLTAYMGVFDLMEIGLERIETVLNSPALPVQMQPATLTQFDITFDQVSFHYLNQVGWAVRRVSFHIPNRSFVALVGSSGSGKTTITQLITRFADVQEGSIQIGSIDIQQVQPAELMRSIAVVFQDVYLFDDTVFNNICLGKPKATNAEVEAAARAANCHEFIMALPQGYNTCIGEIGGALSGGERQRISIARAILKDAPIVLLDEPTSALDTESEVAVQRAIDQLVVNKTVIVIAHRLSTIVGADLILVLEDGHLVEQGTHQQLLAQAGRYTDLWKAQHHSQEWCITTSK